MMFDESTLPRSPAQDHRDEAPEDVRVAVLTMSDTRGKDEDRSGQIIRETLGWRGFDVVAYEVVPDDPDRIREQLGAWLAEPGIDAIITNGGTGISSRDSTYEVVSSMLEKTLDGFGELFRMLSWPEVGAAAMLSRATGGSVGSKAVFCLPGSSNAVRLAMEKLIGPELGHVIHELRKHRA
jgi:molybdenum cofactor biosynthesis protein B